MTIRATQSIASAFGTYLPGDVIDEAVVGVVLEAWLAAGIVANDGESTPVAPPLPVAPIERTTTPKRETTVGRRQAETPHRRFQKVAEPTEHRRFVQDEGL